MGVENLYLTMSRHFYAPGLKATIQGAIKNCCNCQQFKTIGIGYGHLAVRETNVAPCFEVFINTIGPWEIPMQSGNNVCKFYALTMIDTVTNLSELIQVPNSTARAAAQAFETGWLLRFLRPVRLIHDQGTEFMGEDFQALLRQWGIRDTLIGYETLKQTLYVNKCIRLWEISCKLLYILTLHRTKPMHS